MATWAEDIAEALRNLGGEAKLEEIYREVSQVRDQPLPESLDATVRGAIENHSSDSENFKQGRTDYFYSVHEKGKGVWGLRSEFR
jgi:putative restriction endonuclease